MSIFSVVAFPLSATTGTCSATTEDNVLIHPQLISSACSEGRNLSHSGCVSFHDTHTRQLQVHSPCKYFPDLSFSLRPQVLRFSWFIRRLCESPLALQSSMSFPPEYFPSPVPSPPRVSSSGSAWFSNGSSWQGWQQ